MKDNKGKLTPVFKLQEIVQEGASHLKTLHRNMIYPCRSVVTEDTPLLARANILMDLYFTEK